MVWLPGGWYEVEAWTEVAAAGGAGCGCAGGCTEWVAVTEVACMGGVIATEGCCTGWCPTGPGVWG